MISPVAAERCLARDGGGRRGPLPTRTAYRRRRHGAGRPDRDQVRRRLRRRCVTPVSRPNRSRHGWPSGWRPGVWPSTRTRRASSHLNEGFDFLGFNVRRYPNGKLLIKPSKAAIKRIRQRLTAEMRALRGRQRGGGDRNAQPDHPGLGRLLPDGGVQRGVRHRWTTTCGSSPTSGPAPPPRTSRSAGSSPATSAGSTRPGKTGGCSATATAAPTCQVRLDEDRPAPAGQRRGIPRRPGPGPTTGPDGDARPDPPLDQHALRLLNAPARPLPDLRRLPPARRPRTRSPTEWEQWLGRHPQSDHRQQALQVADGAARHAGQEPRHVSYTPTAYRRATAAGSGNQHFCTACGPRACLSRMRGKPHVRF